MHHRRDFLRQGLRSVSTLGALSALGGFGEMNAVAAGANYKALVCVFLFGGNDGHNTVIPVATAQQTYTNYQNSRLGVALPQGSLLPIVTKGNDTYGLHPKLTELQTLYQSGKAAVLANVGMLSVPIVNRQNYLSGNYPVPANLFSHSDQQDQWQTSVPNGLMTTGWGGRLADAVQSMNAGAAYPPVVTTASCGMFCSAAQNYPTTVPPSGAIGLSGTQNNAARQQGVQQLLQFDNGLKLVQASNNTVSRGISNAQLLNNAVLSAPSMQTPFPNTPLGNQLKMVAKIISVQAQLGLSRQIFFCTLGGFDTHSSQLAIQDALLAQLSPALNAFYNATVEFGADQNVTAFTSSEFGRTLMPNSSGGTDHAWGSHHFIVGGAVKGGDLYGQFPLLALGGPNDANNRGTLIPTTAVDQYGATLAQWFGVSPGSLGGIFPNLAPFSAASNLGFLA